MAAPEALSRLTIARTVTPPVIICWAIVCIFCASFCAFWMSNLTPAALNAFSRFGRSWLSQRGEDVVSGRMTPILPEALPPPLLLPLLLLLSLLPPQAAMLKTVATARAVVRVRRRAMSRPVISLGLQRNSRGTSCAPCRCDGKHTSSPLPDRDQDAHLRGAAGLALRLPTGNLRTAAPVPGPAPTAAEVLCHLKSGGHARCVRSSLSTACEPPSARPAGRGSTRSRAPTI